MFGRTAFSLKTKITVLVVFLIVAILLSIGFLQIERDRNLRKEERERRAITVAKTILSFNILAERKANYSEIQRYLRRFLSQEDLSQDIVFVSLHDQKGEILAGAVNKTLVGSYKIVNRVGDREVIEERPIETAEEEREFIDKLYRRRITESSNSLRIVEINLQPGSSAEDLRLIRLGFSTRGLQEEIFQAIIINLSIFAVYIVIGIIASVFLGSAISRPIKVLEEAMKRVSAGDLNQNVDIPSRDEIGTLARTFNYMTEGLREKEKLKKEFLIAREVQFNLLPRKVPEHARLEVATYFEPATEVGGDFYDYLPFGEDKLGVIIGDVSGHGMSAGLLMAITKSCVHTQLNYKGELEQMMASMNEILINLSEPRSLVTLFYSIIDFADLSIHYTDAGHPFTYLIRGNSPEIIPLESIAYPLGVKRGLNFKSRTVKLEPGDILVYYSDGIVEALDEEGSVFGYERLEELLCSRKYESPEEMLDTLITEVRIHIGSAEQFDDMTAVIIRIKS
jgi:serine phosphatase RsbU (regulator of sigma subunit)